MSYIRRVLPALLLLGLVGISPTAHAVAGGGSVTGTNGVLYNDCRQHPYSYVLAIPADASYWSMDVSVLGPDGLEYTTDSVYQGSSPTAGSASFQVCGGGMPGAYSLVPTLEYYDADDNLVTTQLPTSTFTMRLPLTRTTLSVSDRTPKYNEAVTFKMKTADERATGYFATQYADVRLEARRDGRWVKVKGSKTMAGSNGVAKLKYRWNTRDTSKVRAVTIGDEYYAGSVSRSLKVG